MRIEFDLLGARLFPMRFTTGADGTSFRKLSHSRSSDLAVPGSDSSPCHSEVGCGRANYKRKQFSEKVLHGIEGACQELIDGRLHEQFKVDLIQGGAGTTIFLVLPIIFLAGLMLIPSGSILANARSVKE